MSGPLATGVVSSLVTVNDGSSTGQSLASEQFDDPSTTCPLIKPAGEGLAGDPDQVAISCRLPRGQSANESLADEPDQASIHRSLPACQQARENLAAINGPGLISESCDEKLYSNEGTASVGRQSSTMASKHVIGGGERCSLVESVPPEKSRRKAVAMGNDGSTEASGGSAEAAGGSAEAVGSSAEAAGSLGNIDGLLEEKASKTRLSASNVKTIIQEVLTDPGVLAMLKNSLEQDTDKLVPATYEPKMTRAKVKQVLAREGNAPVPWPLSPAKNRDLSYLLSDVALADDEEDDEYCPEPESMDESDEEEEGSTLDGSQLEEVRDDESVMSPAISEPRSAMASTPMSAAAGSAGQPSSPPALVMPPLDLPCSQPARHSMPPFVTARVPMASAVSSQPPTVEMSKDSERRFLKALAELEFEPPIAGRTRSKAPLTEKKLECLEAQLVAPDVLPDMYGLQARLSTSGNADDDDVDGEEFEWKAFLGSIFTSSEDRSMVEEEENDPEYNVLAAIEAEEEEDEDYRNDGKVKIPKAEIHNLMDELVEACEAEDDLPELLPQLSAAEQSQGTSQLSTSSVEHKPRYRAPVVKDLVRNLEQAKRLNDGAIAAVSASAAFVGAQLIPVVTAAESLQIQEHMRKHVQLLLQTFVLTLGRADLQEQSASSKQLLVELATFRDNSLPKSLSHFNAFNLDEAVRIIQDSASGSQRISREDSLRSAVVLCGADDELVAEVPQGGDEAVACSRSGSSSSSNPGSEESRQHRGKSQRMVDVSLSPGEMEFFANCMACLYPALMPRQRLFPALSRRFFTASEDNLIVLGLEQFGETGCKFKWMHSLLLPVHEPSVIKSRVTRVKNGIAKSAALAAYLKRKALPLSMRIIEVFDHSRVCRPIDWDESLMGVPKWLNEFRRQMHGARPSNVSPTADAEQLPRVSPAPRAASAACRSPPEVPPLPLLASAAAAAAAPVPAIEAAQPSPLPCVSGSPPAMAAAFPSAALAAAAAPAKQPEQQRPASSLPGQPPSTSYSESGSGKAYHPRPAIATEADGRGCGISRNCWTVALCDVLASVTGEQRIGCLAPASSSIGEPAECWSEAAADATHSSVTGIAAAASDGGHGACGATGTGKCIAAGSGATAALLADAPIAASCASDPAAREAATVVAVDEVTATYGAARSIAVGSTPRSAGVVAGADPGQLEAAEAIAKPQTSYGTVPDNVTAHWSVTSARKPSEGFHISTSPLAAAVACPDRELECRSPQANAATLPVSGTPTAVLPPSMCSLHSAAEVDDFPTSASAAAASELPPHLAAATNGAAIAVGGVIVEADGRTPSAMSVPSRDPDDFIPDAAEAAVAAQRLDGASPPLVAFPRAPQGSDCDQSPPPVCGGGSDSPGVMVVLTPPRRPELRPLLFRTPSPRRRAPRLLAAATPPSGTSAVSSARFSPLSVKKTLRSPRRRLLRSHVRQLVPKGFVLGASVGSGASSSAFLSACSPTKLVARSLTQRAVKTSVGSGSGGSGRARLMPVNPGRDETLAEAVGMPRPEPPGSRQRGRGRGRAIKTSAGLGLASGCADMPQAVTAASSASATGAADEEDDDLAALMEASTTIRQAINGGSAPCRFKKRKLDRNIACLASDIMATDPLREEKDAAVAKAFLTRCRAVLGRDSVAYAAFLSALADFDGGSTTQLQLFYTVREVLLASGGGCSGGSSSSASLAAAAAGEATAGVAESRREPGVDDLRTRQQLLSDFAAFLSPEQAFECGTQMYAASIEYDRARVFLRKLEVYFGRHAAAYQRIVRLLTSWDESRQSPVELKEAVVPLLKGHPHLLDDFRAFCPEEPVPKRFLADYERIDLSACDDDKVLSMPSLSSGFEEVEMPDVEDTQATEKCRCGCHSKVAGGSQSLLYRQRLVHCRLCCIRVVGGRLYIHTPRGFKPACVSYADQEVTTHASDEKAMDEGSSPQREFVELVQPAGESEEENEDGGPTEDVEEDEEADFEVEQDDDDEVEDYAVDYYDDDASDDDARSAIACSPALCSPMTPGSVASPAMMADEQLVAVSDEPTVADLAIGSAPVAGFTANASISSAASQQANELRPWCRDEDKLILETLQDEDVSSDASDAIFQHIAGQMQDRSFEQVRARFHHLLDLFAKEYGDSIDT